jgi:23S rRNA pseudouridine1911/1915/1917 synthase
MGKRSSCGAARPVPLFAGSGLRAKQTTTKARSSVVERRSYTAHVGGSIPPGPTVNQQTFTVEPSEAGQRLDLWCANKTPASRSALQKAIKTERVLVNGKATKPRYTVKAGDVVTLELPEAAEVSVTVEPRKVTVPILYEDKDVVVVNKPAGLAVYSGQAQETTTVASWFVARYPDSQDVGNDPVRPGIVHRLDKDTSGVLILAKNPDAFENLSTQFAQRRVKKEYIALVFGVPSMNDGRITRPLGRSKRNPLRRTIDPEGRHAVTEWKLEQKLSDRFALLRVWPFTGRMHQIRTHLHFIGHPIVGDALYMFKRQRPPHGVRRQLLHAETLTVRLPSGRKRAFTAPLPADFQETIKKIQHGA